MVLVLVIVFRTSTYSATAESHDERPRADPLTLRLTISGLRIARGPRPSRMIDSWGRVAERGYKAGRFTYVGLRLFGRSFTLLGAGLVAADTQLT